MKTTSIFFIFFLAFGMLSAQAPLSQYDLILRNIERTFALEQYDSTLLHIRAARAWTPEKETEIEAWNNKVFLAIKAQRDQALKDRERAESAQQEARKQALLAMKNETLAIAQKEKAESFVRASLNIALADERSKFDPTLALNIMRYNTESHPDDESSKVNYQRFVEYAKKISCVKILPSDTATGQVTGLAVSKDGKRCYVNRNGSILFWNSETEKYKEIGKDGGLGVIEASADGTKCLYVGFKTKLVLFDLNTGKKQETEIDTTITAIALAGDGSFCIGGTVDGRLFLWKPNEGEKVLGKINNQQHYGPISAVSISQDGSFVLSGSEDKTIRLWRVSNLSTVQAYLGHTTAVSAVAISPDNQFCITSGTDFILRIWETETGRLHNTVSGLENIAITSIQFSLDGKSFFTSSLTGVGRLWDLKSGRRLDDYPEIKAPVAFSEEYIFSGCADRRPRIWKIEKYGSSIRTGTVGYRLTLKELWQVGVYLESRDLKKIKKDHNKYNN